MSDVERGSYTPVPEDQDYEVEEYEIDESEEEYGRGPFLFVVALTVLAAFGLVVYVAYQQGLRQGQRMAPPVIVAQPGPVKVKPEEPGGFQEPFQDSLVLNGDEAQGSREETLRAPPEEPVTLAETSPPVPASPVPVPGPAVKPENMPEEIGSRMPERLDLPVAEEEAPDTAESETTAAPPQAPAPAAGDESEVVVPPPDEPADVGALIERMGEDEVVPAVPAPETPAPGTAPGTALGTAPETAMAPAVAGPPAAETPVPSQATGSIRDARSALSGKYVVQVASVPKNELAQRKREEVAAKHGAVLGDLAFDIQRADLGAKGTYYRVRIGPFASRPEAVDLCETLKARGQDCFVTKP